MSPATPRKGRVLVTGGAGFIGRFVTRSLLDAGWGVRILARRSPQPFELASDDVDVVVGDVLDRSALGHALEGVDTVCHCAGEKRDHQKLFDVNVSGTERLLAEASSMGVRRFVYMSSVAAMGASGESIVDERHQGEPLDAYGKSKRMAEEVVITHCGAAKMDYTIVRPANVFGETDPEKQLLTLIRSIRRRTFWFVGDGRSIANYVYVRDIGRVCARLIGDPEAVNQAYIVSDPCALKDLVACIGAELATAPIRRRMPVWAAYGAAIALAGVTACVGVRSPLSVPKIRAATSRLEYSPLRLRELVPDWPFYGWREGIRRTISAYRVAGVL
jgi:nucleoside-diphosphate-sugar epimerase